MEIQAKSADRNLLLELKGELDHHSARNALREVELAIVAALPRMLVLDFAGVGFMDSSGLGVIFGRYNKLIAMKAKLKLVNVPKRIERILRMAGVYTLIGRGDAENNRAACGGNNND